MLFNIFTQKQKEPTYEDVRCLPQDQQYWASLVVYGGAIPNVITGDTRISSTFAIELMGLTPAQAETFERYHGKVAGLVYNNDTGQWVARQEWYRRQR